MKSIVLLALWAIMFSSYAQQSVPPVSGADYYGVPESKGYPPVILGPGEHVSAKTFDVNGNAIPQENNLRLPVDSTSAYFRMIERMKRLPGNSLNRSKDEDQRWYQDPSKARMR